MMASASTMPLLTTVVFGYTILIYLLRKRHDKFLESTPYPETAADCHKFTSRYIYGDFNFIAVKSLEFGLFKTYAIPSISKLLYSTRELVERCGRRYDDTDLLIREFLEHDPDEPRAVASIDRMNFIHSKYKISNEDYLYVLSVFIVEPIRWVERYGFRYPHDKEKHAIHLRWKIIGEQMGITDIPASYAAMEIYLDRFEEKNMVYSEFNVKVGTSTTNLFLSILPEKVRPMCKPAIYALCPPRLRKAMGFPDPPTLLVVLIDASLKIAGCFVRFFMPPRRLPKFRTSREPVAVSKNTLLYPKFNPFNKTYEKGYKISELGPESLSSCPLTREK
ncbi:hypothetical protein ACHAXM_004377 [Skeletonema potamos]